MGLENGYRDPTADELVQRFRLTSTSSLNSTPTRPSLSIFKRGSSVIPAADLANYSLSRNCVSSLHQNLRSSLLYGKNNVSVATSDGADSLKGYLSLHQDANKVLILKWMPNQLMHSNSQSSSDSPDADNSRLWRDTIMINLHDIIYIHLHSQGPHDPVSLVFVDAEGVQHRPFQFPPGQHCVSFLACLENGLAPERRLDPPLWSEPGKDKSLPPVRRRASFFRRDSTASADDGAECHDYVFRIRRLSHANGVHTPASVPLINNLVNDFQNGFRSHSNSLPNSPALVKRRSTSKSPSKPPRSPALARTEASDLRSQSSTEKASLMDACERVRHQILSRAFHGWLSHCRHLKTVHTHLACTINPVHLDESEFAGVVDRECWERCRRLRDKASHKEFLCRTYLHGIEPDLRRECWPYLLKLVEWAEDAGPRLPKWEQQYLDQVDQWGELEKEVVRRDCEQFENARLRQSSGLDEHVPSWGHSMSSEVFVDPVEPACANGKDKAEVLLENFGTNLHRIEKDVERCDRNTAFFSNRDNLDALKRVMCTYVWSHLDEGYVQGMCDIAGPLLVIFREESLTLECFQVLMEKMKANFPLVHGSGIESHLLNLRTIVQVMDSELFEQFMTDTDFTHLYFAYRWFLLDFKREMKYEDVFRVWEVIWAADQTVSAHFPLFFALALLTNYRQILLENNMEFTDVIKFFNEMAEKHDVRALLASARAKLNALQELVQSAA